MEIIILQITQEFKVASFHLFFFLCWFSFFSFFFLYFHFHGSCHNAPH